MLNGELITWNWINLFNLFLTHSDIFFCLQGAERKLRDEEKKQLRKSMKGETFFWFCLLLKRDYNLFTEIKLFILF